MQPSLPGFEEAINIALIWCNAWEKGELSDEVLADKVAELLESPDGSRGFFAVSLSSDFTLLDRLPDALLIKLRDEGERVIDLIVKNMAMSSAMAIHHKRESKPDQQQGSERIKERCIELLRLLEPSLVKKILEKLLESLFGEGEYSVFLKRWEYDKEQKVAISNSIISIAEK